MRRAESSPSEDRSRRLWLGFIFVFFAAQTMLWGMALWFVSGDRSHAVVASYDARALDWDAQRKRERQSRALGWEASIEVEPAATSTEPSTVELALHDRDDAAVVAERVEVTVFHHAIASERETLTLRPVAPGLYRGSARLNQAGRWRFEVEARRGPDRFVHTESQVVRLGPVPQ